MANTVDVTRASELNEATGGHTDGMVRKGAIVDKSDQLCALVMCAQPHTSSAVHHHGEQDTMVYAAKGHGSIVFDGGKKRKDLSPGDFAIIPAYTEHQEMNPSDKDVEWVITRGGRKPVTVNLEGWSKTSN
ncbi:RmlC-like cupin [Aspergillus sclerotioniger CBS 115572]|uniref:RmlC-like cupin n=1 Tax=Aspergillus sclerotioniger CBS 115572 TaxID=1450535 RepID=A0A317V125_9EURO|nr:RmlC-like cupin [Aspergillus sclerotioniger CBS 115572]PWY67973.1 RmlC-like cupin [Aspergillus sclerotioniger CBS 115572]